MKCYTREQIAKAMQEQLLFSSEAMTMPDGSIMPIHDGDETRQAIIEGLLDYLEHSTNHPQVSE